MGQWHLPGRESSSESSQVFAETSATKEKSVLSRRDQAAGVFASPTAGRLSTGAGERQEHQEAPATAGRGAVERSVGPGGGCQRRARSTRRSLSLYALL